tara:strand:+ start:212 stop:1021 length:810 start_codon:yes stop_codon:yes gene_type:complete
MDLSSKLQNLPKPNIINLTECKDRKYWTEEQWHKHGVDEIHVHSYDRYEEGVSIPFVGDQTIIDQTTKGVTSSHLLTIKWWLENTDEEYGLFFEDDVDYDTVSYWNFTLQEYIEKCNEYDWGCLHMCNVFEYPYDYRNEYIPMVPRQRFLWDHGLQAYALKREYAQKVVDYYFGEDSEKIHYRMPNGSPITTENNILEGFGLVITFPLFNHNVTDFRSKNIYYYNKQASTAYYSYEFLKDWWLKIGSSLSLNEVFNNEREKNKIYEELK